MSPWWNWQGWSSPSQRNTWDHSTGTGALEKGDRGMLLLGTPTSQEQEHPSAQMVQLPVAPRASGLLF